MRSVDEQLGRALAAAVRPAPVRVAIAEAQGLLCAEEVVAERALPGFDQAAVDGYAVRSVDVREAGNEPVVLPVVGEIPAGSRQPRRLQPGQAVRVDTGAPLPTLADAVVPVGYTDGHPAHVTIHQPVPSKGFVRRTGEDVQTGDVAVRRGSPIGSAQVGLLAAVGRSKVLVYPRPRVSIISLEAEKAPDLTPDRERDEHADGDQDDDDEPETQSRTTPGAGPLGSRATTGTLVQVRTIHRNRIERRGVVAWRSARRRLGHAESVVRWRRIRQ